MKIKTSFRLREIIYKSCICKQFVSRIYKGLSRFNRKTTQLKNGQEIWTDPSPKTSRWQINTWKNTQYHYSLRKCKIKPLCAQSCPTPCNPMDYIGHQAPLSMEFARQEYWSGWPFPTLGDLPNPGIESVFLMSPLLAGGFFTTAPPGKLQSHYEITEST